MKQLQSILTDLDNKEITKHQAYDLILVLFDVSESVEPVREGTVCDTCSAFPFDKRGETPLCKTCEDNPKQTGR